MTCSRLIQRLRAWWCACSSHSSCLPSTIKVMRTLTDDEISFISGVAAWMNAEARDKLLSDLAIAQVEAELANGELIKFHLEGHEHPRGGQHLYPVEGEMRDADGSPMSVLLFADPVDRLYELEYLRWGDGPMQNPDWSTLRYIPRSDA
jgi:hypothetical protein